MRVTTLAYTHTLALLLGLPLLALLLTLRLAPAPRFDAAHVLSGVGQVLAWLGGECPTAPALG